MTNNEMLKKLDTFNSSLHKDASMAAITTGLKVGAKFLPQIGRAVGKFGAKYGGKMLGAAGRVAKAKATKKIVGGAAIMGATSALAPTMARAMRKPIAAIENRVVGQPQQAQYGQAEGMVDAPGAMQGMPVQGYPQAQGMTRYASDVSPFMGGFLLNCEQQGWSQSQTLDLIEKAASFDNGMGDECQNFIAGLG